MHSPSQRTPRKVPTMRITEQQLDFSRASSKRTVFQKLFPNGAELTVENARKAARAGLSLRCAAKQLLDEKQLIAFSRDASELLFRYRNLISDTLERLQEAQKKNRHRRYQAELEHQKNMARHWAEYLDRLAEVFVAAF